MAAVPGETRDQLGDQLSALLSDIDSWVRARFEEAPSEPIQTRRRGERQSREGLRGAVALALRWFADAAARVRRPAPRRARSPHERSRGHGPLPR